jgi:four helix bundle protein
MAAQSYRDLIAWQKAIDLAVLVYEATEAFPQREVYGLTNQMRRACVSIPSNIAEGQCRQSANDFGRFLRIALGSLQELETQCILGQRLKLLDERPARRLAEQCSEVGRLLNGLIRSLNPRPRRNPPPDEPLPTDH